MSHIWMSYVADMNESQQTHDCFVIACS